MAIKYRKERTYSIQQGNNLALGQAGSIFVSGTSAVTCAAGAGAFIDFIGTSASDGSTHISSDTTTDSAKFGAIAIEINGATKWIRIYDDHS